jgi:xylan 1,4-beta-xylosidase
LRLESSGYNLNTSVPGQGENLRPALFASGDGAVRFRNYRYRAI